MRKFSNLMKIKNKNFNRKKGDLFERDVRIKYMMRLIVFDGIWSRLKIFDFLIKIWG